MIWAFWQVPETKDRSYEELDVLFESGVKAREFGSFDVAAQDGTLIARPLISSQVNLEDAS